MAGQWWQAERAGWHGAGQLGSMRRGGSSEEAADAGSGSCAAREAASPCRGTRCRAASSAISPGPAPAAGAARSSVVTAVAGLLGLVLVWQRASPVRVVSV